MASKSKPCDSCKSAKATLFCRADSAFLCVNCDTKIHAANKLASRHARLWLCEVCEQAPAHVICKADDATLCVTCDRDIHSANPLSRRHERVPVHVAPSYDDTTSEVSRSEEAEAASWLLPNLNSSSSRYVLLSAAADDHIMDPYLDLDYYLDPKTEQEEDDDDPEEQTTDDGVVPVPAAELLANKPPFVYGRCSFSHSVSSSSSLDIDVGVVPDSSADVSDPYLKSVVQISSADRQARVLRYREKRKNRKFEKTIRYASRKAYAETRPRIKGRFAKRTTQGEIQGRYGVVPSF